MPPRERRPVVMDEAAERVSGREVRAWAAMDADTGELPAIEATWSRSSMDALPFLGRFSGPARTNRCSSWRKPRRSWALRGLGLQYCHGTFGDGSGVERSFGSRRGGRG
ncbi:MAG: hypothetical protein RXR82_08340 [Nitrososphaeria archaeon]